MIRLVFAIVLVLPCHTVVAQTSQPTVAEQLVRLGSRNIRTHDPSTLIQQDNEYWFFCTGPGVRAYQSTDLVKWEPGPRILRELPQWTRQYLRDDRLWAPDIIRAPSGRYLLYYSASSWGKNTSAIGLASNTTLDPKDPRYDWRDEGIVIGSTPKDDFNAIDPAAILDADGKMWLTFGSFWSGIKLIELDPRTGGRIALDSKIYSLANSKEIEAPCIHRKGDKYYLFVNFGLCCRGVNSTYNIRGGRAERITGPYLDKDGRDLLKGGGTVLLGSIPPFIGPGHAAVFSTKDRDFLTCHFYDPTQNGRGTFAIRSLTWSDDGWPTVADTETD